MCKICKNCESIMNYDPYFEAEVCGKCGRIERKRSEEIQNAMSQQDWGIEITRQIFGVMTVH